MSGDDKARPVPASSALAVTSSTSTLPATPPKQVALNPGRIIGGVISGLGAVFFGIGTLGFVFLGPRHGVVAWLFTLAVTGGMGVAMAWLSSRFLRSLPPMRSLATREELDRIDGLE